jgi:tRNA (mo5U34)-methyltransferase
MLFQCLQRGDERLPDLEEDYDFSEWACSTGMTIRNFFRGGALRIRSDQLVHSQQGGNGGDAAQFRLFRMEANPEREVYLCRRGARHYAVEVPPKVLLKAIAWRAASPSRK